MPALRRLLRATACTLSIVLAVTVPPAAAADEPLLAPGAIWRYLDNGSDQGTAWRMPSFDDGAWSAGPAPLGYGLYHPDLQTIVSYGPDASSKYITTYFRTTFTVLDPAYYSQIVLKLRRDDGAVVYVNGAPVWRSNMPAGDVTRSTLAVADAADNGTTWWQTIVPASAVVRGTNVVAIEVHQSYKSSGDILLDFQLLGSVGTLSTTGGQRTFIPAGATWKYFDAGVDLGLAWRAPAFDDTLWPSGPALLGYGSAHPDIRTAIGFGPDPDNKYITAYFRGTFTVESAADFQSLGLKMRRDDGAVVYLNGAEVWRSNMPEGAVTYKTLAAGNAADDGTAWQETVITPTALASGTNVVAVEVHQYWKGSGDLLFDAQLTGYDRGLPATLTRGPYLQSGTSESIIVRWRTDNATDSYVRYGSAPGLLTGLAGTTTVTTEHEVTVTGLMPAAQYFYSVGTATQTLAGNDTGTFFSTSPSTGSAPPLRVWVLGDSGDGGYPGGGSGARAVANAYESFTGSVPTAAWLMLGDNAYVNGTDAEYQNAVFDTYPSMLKKVVLWPAIGNHDTADSTNPPPTLPYFTIFSMPQHGEAGGFASGTEKYYSFDVSNVHLVVLDSMTSDRSPGGPMLTWLARDLGATTQPWLIAYWHHPVYSKGQHDSDVDYESIEMRENAASLLEQYGVDLVLNGHSHTYERSFLLDGHYGLSDTFTDTMKVDGGDGRIDGTGAYRKPADRTPHAGAVYVVDGVGGSTFTGVGSHPAMYMSTSVLGSMVLDVIGDRLDTTFLTSTGAILDHFTILKSGAPLSAPVGLAATAASDTAIALTWSDANSAEAGFRIGRSSDGVTFAELATVGPNVTTYVDSGLPQSSTRFYRVRAYDAYGVSPYSPIASATTLPPPPTAPAAPTNLTAIASHLQVTLSWVDHASNETGFAIERAVGNGVFSALATTGPDLTRYVDTGLVAKTSYRYRVRAFNAVGASAYSNTVTARTPSK